MGKICVIVPSRNETLVCHSVKQYLQSAKHPDDVEVQIILDGWDLSPSGKITSEYTDAYIKEYENICTLANNDSRIRIVEHNKPQGVRVSTNEAAAITECEYILVIDSHCELTLNWDEWFIKSHEWAGRESFIIPRMCSLDLDTLKWGDRRFDHYYLSNEIRSGGSCWWKEYSNRPEALPDICETMANVGATWFTLKEYWWQLGGHDESLYMWGESGPETSLKVWLSGGRMLLSKLVTFAHVFRRRFPYHINSNLIRENKEKTRNYWLNNKYPLQIHPVAWLVGKFWPVPTWEEGTLLLNDK